MNFTVQPKALHLPQLLSQLRWEALREAAQLALQLDPGSPGPCHGWAMRLCMDYNILQY